MILVSLNCLDSKDCSETFEEDSIRHAVRHLKGGVHVIKRGAQPSPRCILFHVAEADGYLGLESINGVIITHPACLTNASIAQIVRGW
jgi:hypothetical protein